MPATIMANCRVQDVNWVRCVAVAEQLYGHDNVSVSCIKRGPSTARITHKFQQALLDFVMKQHLPMTVGSPAEGSATLGIRDHIWERMGRDDGGRLCFPGLVVLNEAVLAFVAAKMLNTS